MGKLGKIKNIIKRILGKANVVYPLDDKVIYPESKGYAGGSLYMSNILLVTNIKDVDSILTMYEQEKAKVTVLNGNDGITKEQIVGAESNKTGRFEHIINLFRMKDNDTLINHGYNDNDICSQVYDVLKSETEYLAPNNLYATICTAVQDAGYGDFEIESASVKACVEGLAKPLGNHRLICNGILADKGIELKDIVATTIYFSSKYGQILAGQVIELKDGKFED